MLLYYRITVQLRYEVGNEQLAVIAIFDTKEKAENYINNLRNFIIGKFA